MLKIPFFRLGTWNHPQYGKLEGTQQMFSQMIENFKNNVLGRPPFVRVGHDKPNSTTFGGVEALGWVKEIVEEEGVLYGLADPTTPEVQDYIRNKKYRFASAEYDPDYIDKESGKKMGPTLLAISLTNEPFLTRLPEARVLSDQPDAFFMDFKEEEKQVPNNQNQTNDEVGFWRSLAMGFASAFKLSDQPVAPPAAPAPAPQPAANPDGGVPAGGQPTSAASDVNALLEEERKKREDLEAKLKALEESQQKQTEQVLSDKREAQVNAKVQELIGKGVPPAMIDPIKTFVLSQPLEVTSSTIKLAEGKEMSYIDSAFAHLDNLPESARVQFGQAGGQSSATPEQRQEEMVKLCDQDVLESGGKIENGKYIL
ncbi:phage protease [Aneurinibacillus sp. Ricciae_BoGa-3]|uniref:phage protease n=1 Tax=Aneurinibacillus sp. Ricciae_BoGa-3 TaxID=3022697 RepID=UPI00233FD9E5|nr:phage protease [Aneurinibacillus sp. Ricciae_BoGa-3]WCK56741.1 phage protease [Aneurinibacillus sp. Ricciae_BoGa-3]